MKLDRKKAPKIILIGIPSLLILLLLPFCIHILSFKQILQYDNIIRSAEKYCIKGNFFLPSLYKITYDTPVEIQTEETVTVFNKNETQCSLEESTLQCNLDELGLQYGEQYELTLISTYNSVIVDELDSSQIETLEPIKIISTNIKQNSTIYDLNPKIVLSTNKPVEYLGESTLEDSEKVKTQLEISTTNKTITLEPKSPLSQKSTYTLTLGNLKAEDGSELTDPFTLKFKI